LRVLHVGNIANNAYLNAKLLRSVGIDAQVLCHDYYHAMACPEWEDADFNENHGDDYAPNWRRVGLRGYQRPEWFIAAPLQLCHRYLRAQYEDRGLRFWSWWIARWRSPTPRGLFRLVELFTSIFLVPRHLRSLAHWNLWLRILRRLLRSTFLRPLARKGIDPSDLPGPLRSALKWLEQKNTPPLDEDQLRTFQRLAERFNEDFPDRPDRLIAEDLREPSTQVDAFREIFSRYDLVQCYSTEPIYALLAGGQPYLAYEHGTLRDFTLGDQSLHRLTALAYRESSHAFITNGDCLTYAEKIGIPRYSAMIHPVDVEQHEADFGTAPEQIKQGLGADWLLLCPIRHDWAIKGTDVHLRALPLIKQRLHGRVVLLLTEWGTDLEASRALIRELGCEPDVVWRRPLPRRRLILYTKAADVLLDQMALPHFGATAPQALAAGTPVVMSYKPETTEWIVDEPAPILSAFTPAEVAQAVEQALDPAWRADFKAKACAWIHRHHHPDRIIRDHCLVYRTILDGKHD
jgi:glycosyltransferase involved in cell wall biosynthesis